MVRATSDMGKLVLGSDLPGNGDTRLDGPVLHPRRYDASEERRFRHLHSRGILLFPRLVTGQHPTSEPAAHGRDAAGRHDRS